MLSVIAILVGNSAAPQRVPHSIGARKGSSVVYTSQPATSMAATSAVRPSIAWSQKSLSMDGDTARRLLAEGGVLVVLDMPQGTQFGIDYHSWSTGTPSCPPVPPPRPPA